MKDCIFCKLTNNEIDSAKIWENYFCTAFLDLYPNMPGQTIVVTNTHYDSDILNMNDNTYLEFLASAKEVVELLKEKLNVKRVALVIEGLGINHAHIKLYPLHGLSKTFEEMWAKDQIYFEKYEGYISTQLGPQADINQLKTLAQKILKP